MKLSVRSSSGTIQPIRPQPGTLPAELHVLNRNTLISTARVTTRLVLAVAVMVVALGWMAGIEPLTHPFPVGDSMKANTALCFALLAGATLLAARPAPGRRPRIAGRLLAVLALIVAAWSLIGYALDTALPIDEFIAEDPVGVPPGRMAPNTAVGFVFVAVALLTMGGPRWITVTATILPLVLGFVAVAGYLIGATELYGLGDFTGMATHTAALFILLTGSILLFRPDEEPTRRLIFSDSGGEAARHLVPLFVGVFVFISWGLATTTEAGSGPPLEAALLGNVILTVGLLTLTWALAGVLHRRDEERRETAEATLREKDRFVASVGHELRTPVAALVGFTELLVSTNDFDLDDGDRQDILATMATQGADLVALLEDLLVAARTDSQSLSVAEVRVNLRAQVAQTVEGLVGNAPDDLTVKGGDVFVTADPLRVRQIMRNLLTNARRYGGERVIVETSTSGVKGVVRVKDDGPGLQDEDAAKIFEPYVTLHGEKGRPGSVGLGLPVARNLAIRMGGDVTYRRSDGWTTFALELPLHDETDESAEESRLVSPVVH